MAKIKITRKLLSSYRKLKKEIVVLELELVEMMEGNIYPLIHAIYYVDTVEIVEIEKQYKQECV